MGKFLSMVRVDSIDVDRYIVLPLGSAGEAFTWLSSLISQGSGTVGFVTRDVAVIAGLKRALLKYDNVPFEVPVYEREKYTKDGKVAYRTLKDSEGNSIKVYDPPASARMSAVFAKHHANGASVHIDRLDGDESVPAHSRELVRVTVQ